MDTITEKKWFSPVVSLIIWMVVWGGIVFAYGSLFWEEEPVINTARWWGFDRGNFDPSTLTDEERAALQEQRWGQWGRTWSWAARQGGWEWRWAGVPADGWVSPIENEVVPAETEMLQN